MADRSQADSHKSRCPCRSSCSSRNRRDHTPCWHWCTRGYNNSRPRECKSRCSCYPHRHHSLRSLGNRSHSNAIGGRVPLLRRIPERRRSRGRGKQKELSKAKGVCGNFHSFSPLIPSCCYRRASEITNNRALWVPKRVASHGDWPRGVDYSPSGLEYKLSPSDSGLSSEKRQGVTGSRQPINIK